MVWLKGRKTRAGQIDDMSTVLHRLGIPLDLGLSDPLTALTGCAAKAGIYQAHIALKSDEAETAVNHASAVLRDQALDSDARYSPIVAAALYVRGQAHRAANHPQLAVQDYQAALAAVPSHELARRALADLEGFS